MSILTAWSVNGPEESYTVRGASPEDGVKRDLAHRHAQVLVDFPGLVDLTGGGQSVLYDLLRNGIHGMLLER